MQRLLLYALSLVALFSCEKSHEFFAQNTQKRTEEALAQDDPKYLTFASQADFYNYLRSIKKNNSTEGEGLRTNSPDIRYAKYVPHGFKTIAQLKEEQSQLRSEVGQEEWELTETLSDTEMSEEEFKIFRAEELLVEPELTFALDTTLRVVIDNELYAVTELGTFVAPVDQVDELEKSIYDMYCFAYSNELLTPVLPIASVGEEEARLWYEDNKVEIDRVANSVSISLIEGECRLNEHVRFINSYRPIEDRDFTAPDSQAGASHPNEISMPAFHSKYDVNTYKWTEKTALGHILRKITNSRNIGRENYFDPRHRAQLYVYDVNLGFIEVVGIKARKQYRRKFLGIKFWKSTTSEKLVVGINQMCATIKENTINPWGNNIPIALNALKKFEKEINGSIKKFVTNTYKNIDVIEDWTHAIAALMPSIETNGIEFNPTTAFEYFYNLPKEIIINLLYKSAKELAYAPLRKEATEEMPRAGFFPNGKGTIKMYVMGVQEYSNIKSKTITLNCSGGLRIELNPKEGAFLIKPFIPREVNLDSFDIFVSIKHNNQWKGVRITHAL